MKTKVRLVRLLWFACAFTLLARAQQPQPPPLPPPGGQLIPKPKGLESAWTLRVILDELLKDNEKLEPLLAQMNPQEWVAKKGASDVYVLQWQTAHAQLKDVMATSKLLAQKTENLPLALDDYFRLEALEVTSRSLLEAVSRYGDRFTADQLNGLIARNFSRRERFRDYLRDLAASSEQDFKLADEEAQRCRGIISKEPVKRAKK
jgi:hypothetical protein